MNYADEPYVRLYINDTVSWKMLSWQAQTVLLHMLKGKFDRSGVFEHGCHEASRGVTAVTGLPRDVTEPGVAELLETKTWVAAEGCLVWPNYVAAQNTPRTPSARKREERERVQAAKLPKDIADVTERDSVGHGVTERDDTCQSVTKSHPRTRAHDKPEPEAEAEQIPPTPQAGGDVGESELRRQAREVFDYWSEARHKRRVKFTTDRRRKVEARLREGYSVDDIRAAIDGVARSPHHRGENDTGQVWDDLTLICRNGSKLESFRDMPERQAQPAKPVRAQEAMWQ